LFARSRGESKEQYWNETMFRPKLPVKKGKPMGRMQRLISIFEPAGDAPPPIRPKVLNSKYPSILK